MNGKTALEQLEYWIEQYYRINGSPTLDDIKGQINLLKDYEREQLHIAGVSRRFTISYYFDDGCETVISIQATSKSEAIEEFWKQNPTADRIHLIYDSFENYG